MVWLLSRAYAPRAVPLASVVLGAVIGPPGLVLAVPFWLGGLPPEAGWVFLIAHTLGVALSVVLTGPLLCGAILDGTRRLVVPLAGVHLSLCLAIPLAPAWETDRAARAAFGAAVLVDDAEPACTPTGDNTFVALSDVHLVGDDVPGKLTNDENTPGNGFVEDRLRFLDGFKPRYLFITGDLTDTGATAEWELAWNTLRRLPDRTRIIIAPGNHDQNEAFLPSERLTVEQASRLELASVFDAKLAAYFKVQARLAPTVVSAPSGKSIAAIVEGAPTPVSVRDWIVAREFLDEKVRICMNNSADENRLRSRVGCTNAIFKYFPKELRPITLVEDSDKYWRAVKHSSFPLVLSDPVTDSVIFVLGSDLSDGASIGANAIGYIDDQQLSDLQKALRGVPLSTKNLIFRLHHPLTRPSNAILAIPGWRELTKQSLMNSSWWTYAFLRSNIQSSKRVLELISVEMKRLPMARGFVLFGHRHERSFGVLDKLTFVESPSVATSKLVNRGAYVGSLTTSGLRISWCLQPTRSHQGI
ncbi:MAG: metallophosphoesterase [Vicinamibacterales bacterium]